MKRTILFIITNIGMMITLGIITAVVCAFYGTSIDEVFGRQYGQLAVFAFVYGFLGAILSLLLSKTMAKISCGAKVIDGTEGERERWLVETVRDLAARANVKMPQVAIYPGAANAFATGAFRNHALVAVSTDIMGQMTKEELRAVLGHEMSHVANGDMVTLTLVQGVLNAFVIFLSRAIAFVISNSGKNNDNRRGNSGGSYFIVWILEMVLGLLSSLVVMWYSRRREFAADAGSAKLLGTQMPMIAALRRLGNLQPGVLPESLKAMGIAQGKRRTSLFASHPALEDRIEALQMWTPS